MNTAHMQKSTKREYWQEHLQQYVASGLSKAAYCREHNLNYHQFSFWYRKFREKEENTSSPFVELSHKYTNTTIKKTEYLVAIDRGGIKVQVNEGVSGDTLKTVIAVLQVAVSKATKIPHFLGLMAISIPQFYRS